MLERIKRWFDMREKSEDKTSEAYEKWVEKTPEGKGKIYETYAYRIPELPEKKVTYTVSELLNGKTKEGKKLPKKVMNKRKDLLEELYTGFFEDFDGDFYKMDIHKKLGIEKCTGHDRFYEPYGIVIDGNGNIENLYTLRAVSSIANMYDNEIRETEKNNLSDGKEKELADGLKNHNEHQTTEIKMINGKEYTTGYMKHRNTMVPIAIPCEKRKDGDTNIEEIIVGEIGGKYMKTDIEGVEKTLDDYVNKISNISK